MSFEDQDWGRPVDASGDFAKVEQLAGHLLIIFPLGYVEHSPTRFTVPGKKSDVIVCDIIDLDALDEQGQPGKIYRTAWMRQAQIIMSLRHFINRRVLVRIGKGVSRNGMNPPWVINDSSTEQGATERALAWGRAHPDFAVSPFTPPRELAPEPQQPQPQYRPPAPPQYQPQPYQQPYQPPMGGGQFTQGTQPFPQTQIINQPVPQFQQPQPQYQAPAPQFQQPQPQQYGQMVSPAPPPPPYQAQVPPVPAFAVQPVEDTTLAYMRAQRERAAAGANDTPGDPPF